MAGDLDLARSRGATREARVTESGMYTLWLDDGRRWRVQNVLMGDALRRFAQAAALQGDRALAWWLHVRSEHPLKSFDVRGFEPDARAQFERAMRAAVATVRTNHAADDPFRRVFERLELMLDAIQRGDDPLELTDYTAHLVEYDAAFAPDLDEFGDAPLDLERLLGLI